jgi:hypothetical protein
VAAKAGFHQFLFHPGAPAAIGEQMQVLAPWDSFIPRMWGSSLLGLSNTLIIFKIEKAWQADPSNPDPWSHCK